MESNTPQVLFICTGNAGRSQMAEAVFKRLAGNQARVASAGVEPWPHLHPVAMRLMRERGIDLEQDGQHPKHALSLMNQSFDVVITLGDQACAKAPAFPGNPRRMHWAIADPADADQSGPDRQEAAFRFALSEIEKRLPELLGNLRTWARAADLHLAPGISTCFARSDYVHPNAFDPAKHLPLLAKLGFKCIELNLCLGSLDFPWDRNDALTSLAKIAADNGIKIFSVHSIGNTISKMDPAERRVTVDLTKVCADIAAMLGALVAPIHVDLPRGMERAAAEAMVRETLAELQEHILPLPCVFGWENSAGGLSAEEHLRWIQSYNPGAIGLTLDTGHSNLIGDTDIYLAQAGPALRSVHLDDNRGKGDEHMIPGGGTFPWKGFVAKLLKTGYVGPLMLEIQDFKRQNDLAQVLYDAMAAINLLREQVLYSI